MTLAVTLRPYQQASIDAIFGWFDDKSGNPLVVLPTGAGKSLVIAGFVHSVLQHYPNERILILTHVRELIAQNHAQMLRLWPDAPAGIYSAGIGRRDHDAHILFAGIQSVYQKAAKIGWVDLVIVDEAHLIPRDGDGRYRQLFADLLSMNSKLRVIGLTATPFRTGEGSLHKGADRMFHGIAHNVPVHELIPEYLSPITNKSGKADGQIDTRGVRVQAGDYVARDLERAAMAGQLMQVQCDEIVARGADRKAWLVFCIGVKHAEAVAEELRQRGVEVAVVFGETHKDERDQTIEAFKAGKIRCIVNVNVLTTGFDAPQVDMVVLLRPTKSPVLYVQMLGRGLRKTPGKDRCIVLDFGGNVVRHGPIDDVDADKAKAVGSRDGGDDDGDDDPENEVKARECPECRTLLPVSAMQCTECHHVFPPPEPDLDAVPDQESTLVRGPKAPHPTGGVERWQVQRVFYNVHTKRGAPADAPKTLMVEYSCGFGQSVREWVCFEHGGFPRRKAEAWWLQRSKRNNGEVPANSDIAHMLADDCSALREPIIVAVNVLGEFPKLLGCVFRTREPGDDDGDDRSSPSEAQASSPDPFADDLPF